MSVTLYKPPGGIPGAIAYALSGLAVASFMVSIGQTQQLTITGKDEAANTIEAGTLGDFNAAADVLESVQAGQSYDCVISEPAASRVYGLHLLVPDSARTIRSCAPR